MTRFRRAPNVVARRVAGELFLVPVSGSLAKLDELFVLNEVAEVVWSRLDEARGPDEIVEAIVSRFAVVRAQAREDLDELLGQLREAGLTEEVA